MIDVHRCGQAARRLKPFAAAFFFLDEGSNGRHRCPVARLGRHPGVLEFRRLPARAVQAYCCVSLYWSTIKAQLARLSRRRGHRCRRFWMFNDVCRQRPHHRIKTGEQRAGKSAQCVLPSSCVASNLVGERVGASGDRVGGVHATDLPTASLTSAAGSSTLGRPHPVDVVAETQPGQPIGITEAAASCRLRRPPGRRRSSPSGLGCCRPEGSTPTSLPSPGPRSTASRFEVQTDVVPKRFKLLS